MPLAVAAAARDDRAAVCLRRRVPCRDAASVLPRRPGHRRRRRRGDVATRPRPPRRCGGAQRRDGVHVRRVPPVRAGARLPRRRRSTTRRQQRLGSCGGHSGTAADRGRTGLRILSRLERGHGGPVLYFSHATAPCHRRPAVPHRLRPVVPRPGVAAPRRAVGRARPLRRANAATVVALVAVAAARSATSSAATARARRRAGTPTGSRPSCASRCRRASSAGSSKAPTHSSCAAPTSRRPRVSPSRGSRTSTGGRRC